MKLENLFEMWLDLISVNEIKITQAIYNESNCNVTWKEKNYSAEDFSTNEERKEKVCSDFKDGFVCQFYLTLGRNVNIFLTTNDLILS